MVERRQQLDTEVFVVGGGPAGLATAIAARAAGLRVMVADCARPPIDKACGEGIMPDGLASLAKLGVTIPIEKAAPFQGIRFWGPWTEVEADFPQGCGLGIRRTQLHEIFVQKAEEAGVELRWGARIAGISETGVSVDGQEVRSRWIVGADGQNSMVRRWAGLGKGSRRKHRYGFRQHFRVAPWSDFVEVYWGRDAQLYVTPVSRDEVCVAMITRHAGLRFKDVVANFPQVARYLKGVEISTREQGAISAMRSFKNVTSGRVALVGEAAGSVDAVTGDGLSIAFQQAQALAAALKAGDLSSYEKAHREIMKLPAIMSRLMLAMDTSAWFRGRVLRALSSEPSLFERLLAMHTGAMSFVEFGLRGSTSLGWQLLTA
jgi:flavin-dependent dehydrogenase